MIADYSAPRVLGDVLYNCADPDAGDAADAETSTEFSETAEQTTSLEEGLSVKLSLELINIAKSSVEFDSFTKQANGFATEVAIDARRRCRPDRRATRPTRSWEAPSPATTRSTTG